MLKLKNVSYVVNKGKKTILDKITLDFGNKGLVLVLGSSGSGKSTLLNIIGGTLKCDGEVWLHDKCINKLNSRELDSYHTMVVGTIFQDYNLIDYMDVYDNVALGCDRVLSSVIMAILKQLNIYDKRYIKVSKLSGGEKQRVAIARALANNPKIILADEPTGALDSQNSILVMEILKKIANERLVIVVSHDKELATRYADRIINIKDGKCTDEPLDVLSDDTLKLTKRKTKYGKIIKLALKNLWLKKFRTLISGLAISLGMVGIFTVTNLYSNFNHELNDLEKRVVAIFPIMAVNGDFQITDAVIQKSDDEIIVSDKEQLIYTNRIKQKYIDYIENIDEIAYLSYSYDMSMPVISDKYNLMDNKYLKSIPSLKFIEDNFDFLAGNNISNRFQILLRIDSDNNVPYELMNYFGIDSNISYEEIIGRKIRIVTNNNYYLENNGYYVPNVDYELMYEESNMELTIVGVIKEKEVTLDESFFYFDNSLIDLLVSINSESNIVKDQIISDYNVLGLNMEKDEMLSFLGYNTMPMGVNIYVSTLEDKDKVIRYLDDYNLKNEKVIYVDTMSDALNVLRQFVLVVGVILIAFSIVAILVSLLMVGILTNVRVLECKREIGILRSLGFSKKNIRSLFNTENVLLGMVAIVVSIVIINLMAGPLNNIVNRYLEDANVFDINYGIFFIVCLLNIIIVKWSGMIPAIRASRMDIVNCIYNR